MKEKLQKAFVGLTAVPFVWMAASWVNVMAHNTTDYVYVWWNMFTIIF